MRAVRSWYGSVQIPRIFCRKCDQWALVVQGIRQCCEKETEVKVIKHKRMIQSAGIRHRPGRKLQQTLLEQFEDRCAYCERRFDSWENYHGKPIKLRLEWDHELPFAYIHSNPKENFLPSCHVCNRWKSSKVFQTMEEVKIYVGVKWEKETRNQSEMPTVSPNFHDHPTMEEIL